MQVLCSAEANTEVVFKLRFDQARTRVNVCSKAPLRSSVWDKKQRGEGVSIRCQPIRCRRLPRWLAACGPGLYEQDTSLHRTPATGLSSLLLHMESTIRVCEGGTQLRWERRKEKKKRKCDTEWKAAGSLAHARINVRDKTPTHATRVALSEITCPSCTKLASPILPDICR